MPFRLLIILLSLIFLYPFSAQAKDRATWWRIQSIDTMKYSRDIAREKLKDSSFDSVIDRQVKDIASTGATHVAVGTPYDEEFVPFLSRWVIVARKYKLNVWFRGKLSGWEKWFGYSRLTPEDHTQGITQFIQNHSDLFVDGDVFSSCPECENGGMGDPRHQADLSDHREFLITEYTSVTTAFSKIKKQVLVLNSSNGDVAKLVMDPPTTAKLGGIVGIDHYVSTPEKLASDVSKLAKSSQGQIFLGEFGVPIPDIHGRLTPNQQVLWLDKALKLLTESPVLGINYWTSVGGSTQLWTDAGKANPAVATLTSYYFPKTVTGTVVNSIGEPLSGAQVSTSLKLIITDPRGQFQLPILSDSQDTLTISASGYKTKEYKSYSNNQINKIIMDKEKEGILYRLKYLIFKIFSDIINPLK